MAYMPKAIWCRLRGRQVLVQDIRKSSLVATHCVVANDLKWRVYASMVEFGSDAMAVVQVTCALDRHMFSNWTT